MHATIAMVPTARPPMAATAWMATNSWPSFRRRFDESTR